VKAQGEKMKKNILEFIRVLTFACIISYIIWHLPYWTY